MGTLTELDKCAIDDQVEHWFQYLKDDVDMEAEYKKDKYRDISHICPKYWVLTFFLFKEINLICHLFTSLDSPHKFILQSLFQYWNRCSSSVRAVCSAVLPNICVLKCIFNTNSKRNGKGGTYLNAMKEFHLLHAFRINQEHTNTNSVTQTKQT